MSTIKETEFYCNRDGLKIFVKEFINEDEGKHPAVILCHGFGANYKGMQPYCKNFAEEGYAAYCFDFCGGCVEGKSEGDSKQMTIQTECMDLLAVLHKIKSFDYIDENHISFMGASQGGFISALTAANCKEQIENIILLFPALCIPDDARRGNLAGMPYDVNNVPEVIISHNKMEISRKFREEIVHMDPYLEIAKYEGRVLILQGTDDSLVNYSYAVRAKESYKEGQCHLQLMRGAGHGFNKDETESAIVSINQFMQHKKELLTIQVITTGYEEVEKRKDYSKSEVYFTGYCDCENFRGSIMPGAVDVQEKFKDDECILHADYTLLGVDGKGNSCHIHIVNEKKGKSCKPTIATNSKELEYLNTADLTAGLECFEGGLTVRIFG